MHITGLNCRLRQLYTNHVSNTVINSHSHLWGRIIIHHTHSGAAWKYPPASVRLQIIFESWVLAKTEIKLGSKNKADSWSSQILQ